MFARVTQPTLLADGVVRLGTELVNWYLLDEGGCVTIVDAGAPSYRPQLERGLAMLGREPGDIAAVILTHAHADHVGFAEPLRADLGIPVYVHAGDEELAKTGKAGRRERSILPYLRHGHTWKLFGHLVTAGMPKKLAAVAVFHDGETLDVPGHPRVLHTPGHTAGHVCFWLESQGVLVAGDLLCSRNPLTGARGPQLMPSAFNASNADLLDSLAKIERLAAETIVFGHGEPWTGGSAEAVRLARATGPT